jgi:uncharacterized protein (TIGR03437 family)
MTSNNTARQTTAVISRKARVVISAVVMLSPVLFFAVQASRKAGATADRQILSRSLAVARNATVQRDDQITQSPEATVQIFGNNAPITINDATPATPYPSTIAVSNVTPATVTRVSVILSGLTHTNPDDVNVLLVGPGGQRTVLIADAGGADDVSGLMLTFSPTATATLPDETTLTTGTYRPANYGTLNDDFPAPGPGTLNNESPDLSVFNLTNPNGDWRLFVTDDRTGDTGQIANGWLLLLTVPTVFTVNSTADPGNGVCDATECTLREAINAAIAATGNSDLVNFSSLFNTPQTINLLTALPDLSESMTIQGPGAHLLTVQRAFNAATGFTIFNIPGGVPQVDIRGMTISNGRDVGGPGGDGFGGGIDSSSNLILTNVHVTGNQAGGGGGVSLAFADGSFTGCTFSSNQATGATQGGGGIFFRGDGGHTLRVVNSTVSGNGSGSDGGISNVSVGGNSRLEVVNSTIANNTGAGSGGGISTFTQNGVGNTATTTLRNTIVANNTPNNLATGTVGGGAATFTTNGFNLSDNFNGGGFTPLASDITAQPRLGPLSLGGGTTPTHALLGGSPALNAGDASGLTTDQRGVARPSTGADIGAVEMQSILVANTNDSGAFSLRQAITTANTNGAGLDDIIFDNTVFNTQRTITLTTGELAINTNLTINAPGANLLTVSGNNSSRVFSVISNSNAIVSISSMTISGGNVVPINGFGGGIFNGSTNTLTVTNSIISGNSAFNGGGIRNSTGTLTVTNSTISGNTATRLDETGGGIDNRGSLTVTNSTISGNSAPNGTFNLGGGIFTSGATATITNCTITNNSAAGAASASGVFRGSGSVTIRNSLIAANVNNATEPDVVVSGGTGITSNGFNLIGNRGAVAFGQTGDQSGGGGNPILDPRLGPLANNGGPTQTHALLFGSPALDVGNASGATADQRGLTRPFDLPGIANVSDGADIGAFEANTAPDNPPTAAATAANVTTAGASGYTFTVTYTDDIAINVATINTDDVRVTGPNGFNATPVFASVDNNTNGTPRSATYQITPPGGSWDTADNGAYNVVMQTSQVFDTSGNFVAAGNVGSFMVNIFTPQTFTVANTNNAGAGSLRQAVTDANANGAGADTINFSALFNTAQTITLTTGQLSINSSLTINGPGANLLTVSGNNASRVFLINSGFSVSLSGITITGGNGAGAGGGDGGGALNNGALTVTNSTISGNTTDNSGGGIGNFGVLTVINSTISGNTANGFFGGGSISNGGTLTVTSSTISGNSAPNGDNKGGGILTFGAATITNCTITNNAAAGAASAGGVFRSGGTVTIRNSLIAANVNNASQPDVVAVGNSGITSNGYNLIGNRGTVAFSQTGDQSGGAGNPILNPFLGPLADNGGPTQTHALLVGSPAIDKGSSSGQIRDQRGVTRPLDDANLTNATGGDGADIGAFERSLPTVASASSYKREPLAQESIVAAFGETLTANVAVASALPLPTTLDNTTVNVLDAQNTDRPAPLFYVSPSQINFQIPPGTATGNATVIMRRNGVTTASTTIVIAAVEPSLFTANSSGSGAPAAFLVRVKPDNSQTIEPVATVQGGAIVPAPISLGPQGDQLILVLFGTGIRKRSALSAVTLRIDTETLGVVFADPAPGFIGLDQINSVALPRSLAGKGTVNVTLTVDGRPTNTVLLNFQ